VHQLIDIGGFDRVAALQVRQLRHRPRQALSLRLLAVVAASRMVELRDPDGPLKFDEMLEGPLWVLAIRVPDGNIPLDPVGLHAVEGTKVSPPGGPYGAFHVGIGSMSATRQSLDDSAHLRPAR